MPPDPKLTFYAGAKSPHETTDLIVLGLPFKTTEEQVSKLYHTVPIVSAFASVFMTRASSLLV